MIKYPKGTTVIVYEGSKLIDKFALRTDILCKTGLNKYIFKLYPHLDHTQVSVVKGD